MLFVLCEIDTVRVRRIHCLRVGVSCSNTTLFWDSDVTSTTGVRTTQLFGSLFIGADAETRTTFDCIGRKKQSSQKQQEVGMKSYRRLRLKLNLKKKISRRKIRNA